MITDNNRKEKAKNHRKCNMSTSKYKHITTTRSFRELVYSLYPGLNTPKTAVQRKAYAEFFLYLLAGHRASEDDEDPRRAGRLLLDQKTICRIELGFSETKNYSSLKFLEQFRYDVFNNDEQVFSWKDYLHFEKLCRVLENFNLAPAVVTLYEQERLKKKWVKQNRVYFTDGSQYSGRKRKKFLDEYRLEAAMTLDYLPQAMQDAVLKLNQQPVNIFNKLIDDNLEFAIDTAMKLPVKAQREPWHKSSIDAALDTLTSLRSLPQPVYKGTETNGATRIQTYGQNLTRLSRPVRAALLNGLWSADCASMQLAIAAKVLNIESIIDFLKTGQSFWTLILDHLKIPEQLLAPAKCIIKEALYSLLYGMPVANVKGTLTRYLSFIDKNIATNFTNHPMISEIAEAMDCKRLSIEKEGFYIDAFDRKIEYEGNSKSSLALLMQSYESLIMSSIYNLDFQDAKGNYNFTVVAHLHDGLYFNFKNEKHRKASEKEINNAVNTTLDKLGIPSKLEWEYMDTKKVETELAAKELELKVKQKEITLESSTPKLDIPKIESTAKKFYTFMRYRRDYKQLIDDLFEDYPPEYLEYALEKKLVHPSFYK